MGTAIRNVELSLSEGDLVGLTSYERCMLVLRWHGRVIGRTFVPLSGDRLTHDDVLDHARGGLTADALRAWIEDTLQFDERQNWPSPDLAATVAICTRERPEDLDRALAAVRAQVGPSFDVLVVDNAPSTDRTRRVVQRHRNVRYAVEPRPGLNCARNRALDEASGDIVAFTDDDATPEPGWLAALMRNFGDPRVFCVTGLTLPSELDTAAQELFEEHCTFVRGFARRVFDGRVENPLMVARVGAGANMALRRTLPELVGPFDERLDAGTPTRSGGDHEMFTRILSTGRRIVYEPKAVSWHRHRRTIAELHEVVQGYGTGVYAMWTGLLLERRDLGVLRLAWQWFRYDHLPLLRRPSRLRSREGRDVMRRLELRGCLRGPLAWFASRRQREVST
jgi:glycosyltransferase involved in cell wall biosynthesis